MTGTLTAQQLALAGGLNSGVVLAGPGSGKTRAVIARLSDHPAREPSRGVALLSFTNAVVEEARLRSSAAPHLVSYPNHVGTIDSFLYEFVVAPCWTSAQKRPCSYVPSREELRAKWFEYASRLWSLEWFDVAAPGAAVLKIRGALKSSLGYPNGMYLAGLEDAANTHWQLQISMGNFDSDSARSLGREYLDDKALRASIENLLAARFFELIVDEAQDMSESDHVVVELFEAAGARVLLVGDPDQGIFGFRGGRPTLLTDEAARIGQGESLTSNFRSTPAICQVVSALRDRKEADVPSGPGSLNPEPLVLMHLGDAGDFRDRLVAATAPGEDAPQYVVLAYKAEVASEFASGVPAQSGDPTDPAFRLASEIQRFWIANDGTERSARALARIGRLAMSLVRASDDTEIPILDDGLLIAVVASAGEPRTRTREAYSQRFSQILTAKLPAPGEFEVTFPALGHWFSEASSTGATLAPSTIHAMKGLEANRAVVLSPDLEPWQREPKYGHKSFGDVWQDRLECETRRVLYVAASRAIDQLVFAVGPEQYPQFVYAMARDGVNFREA